MTLSALLFVPVRIYNIRAGRKNGGLKEQHLRSIYATGELVSATIRGAEPGSKEVVFVPHRRTHRTEFSFELRTAGSVGLVFQTVLLPLSFHGDCSLVLKGGTHVHWSPIADYIKEVFLPAVTPMGIKATLEISRYGFYPEGGGIVESAIKGVSPPLKPINVMERGELKGIYLRAGATGLPVDIPERGIERALERLKKEGLRDVKISLKAVDSPGKGVYMFLLAEYENIRAGFTALGQRGKRMEAVADELIDEFLGYSSMKGAVDSHLSDQLLLYMALAEGVSRISTPTITLHARTNASVIERFLPVRFEFSEDSCGSIIKVEGMGYGV